MKEKRNKYRAISLGKCTPISLSHSRTAVLRARTGRTITDCRSKIFRVFVDIGDRIMIQYDTIRQVVPLNRDRK